MEILECLNELKKLHKKEQRLKALLKKLKDEIESYHILMDQIKQENEKL